MMIRVMLITVIIITYWRISDEDDDANWSDADHHNQNQVTGGFIFNHLASPGGNLAVPGEEQSFDSCRGHSEPSCRF